jgi:uncharacterized protein HemX
MLAWLGLHCMTSVGGQAAPQEPPAGSPATPAAGVTTTSPATDTKPKETPEPAPARNPALDPVKAGEGAAIAVLLLIALACVGFGGAFLYQFWKASVQRELVFRRHWGGFGGDSSGWQISAPFGAAILGLLLITIGISLASSTLYVMHEHTIEETKPEKSSAQKKTGEASGEAEVPADEKEEPAEELQGQS